MCVCHLSPLYSIKNSEMAEFSSRLFYYIGLVILIGSISIQCEASDENREARPILPSLFDNICAHMGSLI